ncbi:probable methyltransferase PMT13 isoform X2 [Punica granatum]|uniref:Methyltransferase n=1 Tax=Punica granatum TaxID=22663 RepID=A0A6P8BT77_PUNGR|nr:probable methyltransferase PMT13 isoform X2 [Punica granatum]
MRGLNLKRNPRQWRLWDLLSAALLAFVLAFFFVLVAYSPLGSSRSSSSASRRQAVIVAVRDRSSVIAAVESGKLAPRHIEICPADYVDYMPCEDPKRSSQLSREMNYYRERHCPRPEETPLCLIPPPKGYKIPILWPDSLNKIWHSNMPHNKIADRKGHQGWMKVEGPYFIFPGGGTMFPDGAGHYIGKLKKHVPLAGGVIRTALDMGCGVASFGGSLLAEGILTMSFAPRDSHKSQIQFALERGIPAFVAMLGTRRLPFPAFAFDFVHCSRCLIPFTAYNATYFIEVDRLLRPGGYLIISGPPVKWAKQEKEWADLQAVAKSLCYELVVVDGNTAIWKKRTGDSCHENGPKLCDESEDPNVAWYYKMKRCVSRTTYVKGAYAVGDIPKWPERLTKAPDRAAVVQDGIDVFETDRERWARRVAYYKNSLKLKLGTAAIRNVMDVNAFFGGFAAALSADPVWVMNIVPSHMPSTLSVIYDRGLIGVYHDWCEPFSTYPRTYDFIHVDGIESLVKDQGLRKTRCNLVDLMVEMDRILRPKGTVLIRDSLEVIERVDRIARAVRWKTVIHENEPESHSGGKILVATKEFWTWDESRPD